MPVLNWIPEPPSAEAVRGHGYFTSNGIYMEMFDCSLKVCPRTLLFFHSHLLQWRFFQVILGLHGKVLVVVATGEGLL